MKYLGFLASVIITLLLTVAVSIQVGPVPPLAGLMDPFHGFWQNSYSEDALAVEKLELKNLKAPVEVVYDQDLIPHVFADNREDLYRVQGYVTAQHRLWQMEFQTMAAAGRLSEIVGARTVEFDRMQRRKGLGFGAEAGLAYLESKDPETLSLINANSPMVFDETMLGAAKVYARANQATIVTPFILAGAMSPVTVAGTLTQVLAEVLAGAAFTQLVRPGAPVLFGTFASSISMQSGAPTFGTPEPTLVSYGAGQLARRLGLPFRTGGSLCGSKIPDAQAAYESANTLNSTLLAGTNFVLHAAGWLEGGLASCYEKFMMDVDQLGMQQKLTEGVDLSENGQAMDAIREVGPGSHYLGCSHTQANFQTAFVSTRDVPEVGAMATEVHPCIIGLLDALKIAEGETYDGLQLFCRIQQSKLAEVDSVTVCFTTTAAIQHAAERQT